MKKETNRLLTFIKAGIFPYTIFLFLCVFIVLYSLFEFPPPAKVVIVISEWFKLYGYWVLIACAILEGLFVIGMYFPGSLAIAIAIYSLGNSAESLFYIGLLSFFSFLLANIINYFLGQNGYYRFLVFLGGQKSIDTMHRSMLKHGDRIFFITGFFPNFIAITSVCAGISKFKFIKFVRLLSMSLAFWITIWTITASYLLKSIDLTDNNQTIYLALLIFIWGLFLSVRSLFVKQAN